jgi:polyisoprenoid-binding protein YceI
MPSLNRSLAIASGLLWLVVLTGSSAVAPIRFQPESKLWVEGTSTVRDYTCRATSLEGSVTPTGADASLAMGELEKAVRTVDVSLPVQGLECGNGTMNGHLRNALKAQQNPTIRFRLSHYELAAAGQTAGTATLQGTLAIAGQEKPVSIEASVSSEGDGAVRVKGSKEILMSEYGVRPPTLMMGTLKVRDRVVVHFDVLLKQS